MRALVKEQIRFEHPIKIETVVEIVSGIKQWIRIKTVYVFASKMLVK